MLFNKAVNRKSAPRWRGGEVPGGIGALKVDRFGARRQGDPEDVSEVNWNPASENLDAQGGHAFGRVG